MTRRRHQPLSVLSIIISQPHGSLTAFCPVGRLRSLLVDIADNELESTRSESTLFAVTLLIKYKRRLADTPHRIFHLSRSGTRRSEGSGFRMYTPLIISRGIISVSRELLDDSPCTIQFCVLSVNYYPIDVLMCINC